MCIYPARRTDFGNARYQEHTESTGDYTEKKQKQVRSYSWDRRAASRTYAIAFDNETGRQVKAKAASISYLSRYLNPRRFSLTHELRSDFHQNLESNHGGSRLMTS